MAINFPSSPSDGDEYTDVNSGTWVYDSGTNSWTLTAAGSASAFNFRGGHDFTQATPPAAPIKSGDLWVHDGPAGTVNGVYNGLTGTIPEGQLVLWDGSKYVAIASSPGYPDLGDGGGSTLDDRYLQLNAGTSNQSVTGTGTVDYAGKVTLGTDKILLNATDGVVQSKGGLETTGGDNTNNSLIQLGTGTNNKAGIKLYTDKTAPGAAGVTVQINASDGTADFAGAVRVGDGSSGVYSYLSPAGNVQGSQATKSTNDTVWEGYGAGDLTSFINSDGSSFFAAAIQCGGGLETTGGDNTNNSLIQLGSGTGNKAGVKLYTDRTAPGTNGLTVQINASDGTANFAGTITTQGGAGGPYVAIGQTITFNTEADDDANYTVTTDVDEEGNTVETRVYNGPTLDVKERLQNLLARVDAMEANEVIDDATDSSLLTLVSNLDTRLNGIEARIAALEAA